MVAKTVSAITCVALLASCGHKPDMTPCGGWAGGAVLTERDFALAASAEMRGRVCAEKKLEIARKFYQGR